MLAAAESLSAASEAALSLSEKSSVALSTTLTGLVVVFLTLILLTFVITLFGKIVGGLSKKPAAAEKAAPEKAEAPAPAAQPVVEEESADNDELIAVISAAVYAYGEASGKQYVVRAVKPSGRSSWAAAGVAENTRAF